MKKNMNLLSIPAKIFINSLLATYLILTVSSKRCTITITKLHPIPIEKICKRQYKTK